jgi:hypothetical protein
MDGYAVNQDLKYRCEWEYPIRRVDALFLTAIFLSFTLVAIGAVCLASPRMMRDYEVQQVSKHFPQSPFLEWMRTERYLLFLRLLGIAVLCLGLLLAILLLKRLWGIVFI